MAIRETILGEGYDYGYSDATTPGFFRPGVDMTKFQDAPLRKGQRLILRVKWSGVVWAVDFSKKVKGLIQINESRKADALAIAKTIAEANKPSQVVVHKRNGQFQTEYTYGNDPKRSKG
jgi:hypothetical protein